MILYANFLVEIESINTPYSILINLLESRPYTHIHNFNITHIIYTLHT